MKRNELAYELAEKADIKVGTAKRILNELGNLFIDWLEQDDDEFPVGHMGLFRKENGRLRWKMSRKAKAAWTRRASAGPGAVRRG